MKDVIEIFHHNENGVTHHLAASTFFVEEQDQHLLKAQAIYSARKVSLFKRLSKKYGPIKYPFTIPLSV